MEVVPERQLTPWVIEPRCPGPACGVLLADEGLVERGYCSTECEREASKEVTSSMEARIPQGNSIGDRVPEGWYTRHQAAAMVGRTYDTLKRWAKLGEEAVEAGKESDYILAIPSGTMKAGQLDVHLYNDQDIANLQEIARTRVPGVKRAS